MAEHFQVKTTGYSEYGHYHIGQDDLKFASLDSLEVLCFGIEDQMTDADIMREHKKTGDYDTNEMHFNIWVNGFLIQFCFELMGLHVEYDAWELLRPGHCHTATPALVSGAVSAAVEWLSGHSIEEISEEFYKEAEQGIAQQIVDYFTRR